MGGGNEADIMAAKVDKVPDGEANKKKEGGDDNERAALRA